MWHAEKVGRSFVTSSTCPTSITENGETDLSILCGIEIIEKFDGCHTVLSSRPEGLGISLPRFSYPVVS
jgi:hypothetical protein